MNLNNVISFDLEMVKTKSGIMSGLVLRVYNDNGLLRAHHKTMTLKNSWIVNRIKRGEAVVKTIKMYG